MAAVKKEDAILGWPSCECGCGQPAPVAKMTIRARGWIKGRPVRYIRGHIHRRPSSLPEYVEEDRGFSTPCWITTRPLASGYGRWLDGDALRPAHVVMYERTYGPIPVGKEPDHLCRVRACIRPDHMDLVSHAVNVQRGAKAKLTADQVAAIRASEDPVRTLSARYGVSEWHIRRIRKHIRWVNIVDDGESENE